MLLTHRPEGVDGFTHLVTGERFEARGKIELGALWQSFPVALLRGS